MDEPRDKQLISYLDSKSMIKLDQKDFECFEFIHKPDLAAKHTNACVSFSFFNLVFLKRIFPQPQSSLLSQVALKLLTPNQRLPGLSFPCVLKKL